MAISTEDRKDVKSAFGKVLAKKVANVTHDYPTIKIKAGKVKGSSANMDAKGC